MYSAVLGCGIPLVPELVKVLIGALDKGIRSAGGCTTAMTMVLIGMMFSGMSLRSMIDKQYHVHISTPFGSYAGDCIRSMPILLESIRSLTGVCTTHHWHAGRKYLRNSCGEVWM